jgi:hypothetical protein
MNVFFGVRKSIYKVIFIVGIFFLSFASFAAPNCSDPLNPNPDLPDCNPDIPVPLDDGVYFLLAAGILIGYTLLKQKRELKAN